VEYYISEGHHIEGSEGGPSTCSISTTDLLILKLLLLLEELLLAEGSLPGVLGDDV
jgi:hypothetical protein